MFENIDVVILCGGRGNRLNPITQTIPKPLVKIGDIPILEHIMRGYMHSGFSVFKLLLGYKKEKIINYFKNNNTTNVELCFYDTGVNSDTAERIWCIRNKVSETFALSYSDVLANINFRRQHKEYKQKGKIINMAVVPLRTTYGVVNFDNKRIMTRYLEKPIISDYWINAGFFIVNRSIFDHWTWNNTDFSKGVIPHLALKRMVSCYLHKGFWSTLDTCKEYSILNELWKNNRAEWAIWKSKKSASIA